MSATLPPENPAPGYGEQYYGQPRHQAPGAWSSQGPASPPYGAPSYGPYPQQQGYGQQGYGQQPGYARNPFDAPSAADPTDVVGPRVGQYLLDALLVSVPMWILYAVVTSLLFSAAASAEDPSAALGMLGLALPVLVILGIAAGWGVMAWWPSTHQGQTPAMRWLKLRIVNEDGTGVPALGQLTMRWLLLIVDGLFFGLVGFLVMNSSPRHQRLGDKVGRTVVVRA